MQKLKEDMFGALYGDDKSDGFDFGIDLSPSHVIELIEHLLSEVPKLAAAPDMYEALEHICDRLYSIAGNEELVSPELYRLLKPLYKSGYKALAKAEGG